MLIDGADIREVDLASLRHEIAFVADDSFLFSDTVAGNIAYANPDATRAQIEVAARRAQAHDFITRLPDGYETVVGERGLTLSGGQRQRVAIARALLAEPRDPDPRRRDLVRGRQHRDRDQEGAVEAMDGRTTFVVAHRLSTISLADEIVVLDHGRHRRPRHARGAARALPALRGDRREGARGLGLPAARPRGARGAGATMTSAERRIGRRRGGAPGGGARRRGGGQRGGHLPARGQPAARGPAPVRLALAPDPGRGPARTEGEAGC